jgi:folate-binding protein YgfZ
MRPITLSQNYHIPLNQLGLIHCTGPDAARFLQGQLSCDVNQVTDQTTEIGCYCDQKGRVLSDLRLVKSQEGYLLQLPRDLVATILAELLKFARFSKVILVDVSAAYDQIGVLIGDPQALDPTIAAKLPLYNDALVMAGQMLTVRVDRKRCLVLIKRDEPASLIKHLQMLPFLSVNDWELMDYQQGFASISPQTAGRFTPHQLNYQITGAISLNKGCYRGQEIIARTHYLGKLKQQLYLATLQSEQPVSPGMALSDHDDQIVGYIVNASKRDDNHYQVLATVYSTAKEQNQVFLQGPGKEHLQFLPLPQNPRSC